MSYADQTIDNVFILGAGASADSGAPLMNNFMDKAEDFRDSDLEGQLKYDFDRVFKAIYQL